MATSSDELSEAMKLMRMDIDVAAAEKEQIKERQFAEALSVMNNKMEEMQKRMEQQQMEQQQKELLKLTRSNSSDAVAESESSSGSSSGSQGGSSCEPHKQHRKPHKSHRDDDYEISFKVGSEVAPQIIGVDHCHIKRLAKKFDVNIRTSKKSNWTIRGEKIAVNAAFECLKESKRLELIRLENKAKAELAKMNDHKSRSKTQSKAKVVKF
jgi:phosphate starvation-inducible protein PhoH